MRFTVKLGGSILESAETRRGILGQVVSLVRQGHEIIVVHGGGKSLSRRLAQLGIESRFVDGLRVTDAATLGAAVMVLSGEVNKMLVCEIAGMGCEALGICGADASAVRCRPLSGIPGAPTGLGFVGKPVSVNTQFFDLLLDSGLVPVVSSIALGPDHQLYNVNADQVASMCACGTGSRALVYLTDVPGVRGADDLVLRNLGRKEMEDLRTKGVLSGGMLPKTAACLEALEHGVESVYILPGDSPDALSGVVSGNVTEGTYIHGND